MTKTLKISMVFLVLVFTFLTGCNNLESTARKEKKITEKNQEKLLKAVPPPELETSLERKNLVKRLTRFNEENKISYIYTISHSGSIILFTTVKGKVSSVNSLLTIPEVYDHNGAVLPSPDLDGSYGSNGNAIFWFDSNDVYHEWNGEYHLVDEPLKLTSAPVLIQTVE